METKEYFEGDINIKRYLCLRLNYYSNGDKGIFRESDAGF